jgi:hypothetical protein
LAIKNEGPTYAPLGLNFAKPFAAEKMVMEMVIQFPLAAAENPTVGKVEPFPGLPAILRSPAPAQALTIPADRPILLRHMYVLAGLSLNGTGIYESYVHLEDPPGAPQERFGGLLLAQEGLDPKRRPLPPGHKFKIPPHSHFQLHRLAITRQSSRVEDWNKRSIGPKADASDNESLLMIVMF